MSISTGTRSNSVDFPEVLSFLSRRLNPNAPPFIPRPTAPRLTAARKKSLRLLKLFPLNLKFRKLNKAQSAAIRIRRKGLVKTIRLNRELKELREDVLRMVDSVKTRQEILFRQALSAHSITLTSPPPPMKRPVKSGTKRNHGPSPLAPPPPIARAPKRKRTPSPPAVSSPSIAQSFKGLKKGWFDKL